MQGLVLESVEKTLGGRPVIRGLDLTVEPGELVCLLGPSGCGKTTTLRMVGGFLYPDRGRILIDGQDVSLVPPERRPTAMVFQNYALWPHMTVYENIAFGLRVRRLPGTEIRSRVEQVLRMVGMLELRDRRPAHISGGEQQRVALARALVLEPKVLLLDEPLSNLDAKLRAQVREEIREIQQRIGITSVFVTHDQDEALSIADRVAVMSNGQIEQFADPPTLYREPRTQFVAQFVGTMNFYRGTVAAGAARLDPDGLAVPVAGLTAGDGQLEIGVRPEEVRLAPAGGDGGVPASLLKRIPRGHFTEVVVAFGEHTARVFVPLDFALPERLEVSFGRVLLYRDGILQGDVVRS
jgi:putative spermidine/putrescine transport system ATP-binding protein